MTDKARLVQRVAAHGDRLDLNDRVVPLRSVSSRVFAKGRFALAQLGENFALEHDLGVGRHFQIQGPARHQIYGLAHDSARDGEFVRLQRRKRKTADVESRVVPDGDRHRGGFILPLVGLPNVMTMSRL